MTDEILAHISAPATRQTDDLYQSLVDAYHDFEPSRALRDPDLTDCIPGRPNGASACDNNLDIITTSITASSKDSFGSFPSRLSSEDHVNSYTQGPSQTNGDSTEYGSILMSSRLARLERIHQNWKDKITPKTSSSKSFRSPRLQSQMRDDEDDGADTAFIEDTQLAMQALQSQLEESHSTTSEDTSESEANSEEYTGIFQLSDVPDDQHELVTARVHETASSAGTSRPDVDAFSATLQSNNSASSSFNVVGNVQSLVPATSTAEVYDFSELPIHVFPPPPEVSVLQPDGLPSQTTSYLKLVKNRHPNRYHLVRRKYKPNDDDRGYWVVNCATWPVEAQLSFWSSLQDYLLKEKLGWGTTLHRIPKSPHEMGEIRLYCWAEVVEHMWLQLWLSSGGYISHLNWYDAEGSVVLQAKLRQKKPV